MTEYFRSVANGQLWPMVFSSDPTSRGDEIADYLRQWYEANRESWWDRHRPQLFSYRDNSGVVADGFMLSLLNEIDRITNEAEFQMKTKGHTS